MPTGWHQLCISGWRQPRHTRPVRVPASTTARSPYAEQTAAASASHPISDVYDDEDTHWQLLPDSPEGGRGLFRSPVQVALHGRVPRLQTTRPVLFLVP